MNRCLLVLWFACLPVWSAALVVDPAKSRVSFTYQQMGSDVEGEFKRYQANIAFDTERPEAGQVVVIIDPAGVDAGHPDANSELLRPAFFDVPRFPQARFESTRIKPLPNSRYDVEGKLTIKGVTRLINSRAQIEAAGTALQLLGTFDLKRLDFGIGSGIWNDVSVLGNNIRVTYSLRLLPAPAAKKK